MGDLAFWNDGPAKAAILDFVLHAGGLEAILRNADASTDEAAEGGEIMFEDDGYWPLEDTVPMGAVPPMPDDSADAER